MKRMALALIPLLLVAAPHAYGRNGQQTSVLPKPKVSAIAAIAASQQTRKYLDQSIGRKAYISSLEYGRIRNFRALAGLPRALSRKMTVWLVTYTDPTVRVSTGLPKGCRYTAYVVDASRNGVIGTICLDR